MEEAITRHEIARHYQEQRQLHPLAMQTRNQSRTRGSSIVDTSRLWSLVQKRIQETNKEYITSRQTYSSTHPLLMVKVHLAGEEVEAVVDTGASASVVGKCLARKLKIWKRAKKVKVR